MQTLVMIYPCASYHCGVPKGALEQVDHGYGAGPQLGRRSCASLVVTGCWLPPSSLMT